MIHIKNLESEFKENGPWSKLEIDLVVPFYNEEKNVVQSHSSNKRLERLFNIKSYIYVNNGSADKTLEYLQDLVRLDNKVKVVSVKVNTGYGDGMKAGMLESSAGYILTNHADMQFDSYSFFTMHLTYLMNLKGPSSIFPKRINRPLSDRIFSFLLRSLMTVLFRMKIEDFNGQPKLISSDFNKKDLDMYPNEFSFDLALFVHHSDKRSLFLPVFQLQRFAGQSSWNVNLLSRFRQIKKWLLAGIKLSFAGKVLALRVCQMKNKSHF